MTKTENLPVVGTSVSSLSLHTSNMKTIFLWRTTGSDVLKNMFPCYWRNWATLGKEWNLSADSLPRIHGWKLYASPVGKCLLRILICFGTIKTTLSLIGYIWTTVVGDCSVPTCHIFGMPYKNKNAQIRPAHMIQTHSLFLFSLTVTDQGDS